MLLTKENTIIGFIGTGLMGKSMARHLIKAGYPLVVHNRTKEKAEELIKDGAKWCDTVSEVAAQTNVILTIIGYPKDVEDVYLGPDGIINNARSGTYFVDMTTSSPTLAKKIYQTALSHKMFALDAPVTGGVVGAREASLTIMVGGERPAFETVKPVLSRLGTNITLLGGAGAGQYTKLCNQIAIASNMIGVAEAIAFAKKAGLDPLAVSNILETGTARSFSLSQHAPRMIDGNYAPGFYVKHFI